jgi:hypothetical protein
MLSRQRKAWSWPASKANHRDGSPIPTEPYIRDPKLRPWGLFILDQIFSEPWRECLGEVLSNVAEEDSLDDAGVMLVKFSVEA